MPPRQQPSNDCGGKNHENEGDAPSDSGAINNLGHSRAMYSVPVCEGSSPRVVDQDGVAEVTKSHHGSGCFTTHRRRDHKALVNLVGVWVRCYIGGIQPSYLVTRPSDLGTSVSRRLRVESADFIDGTFSEGTVNLIPLIVRAAVAI